MRIVFFLRNLQTGGAERQFLQLMEGLAERGHAVQLVTRTPGGALSHLLPEGVERRSLFAEPPALLARLGRALELARTPGRLRRLVAELAPDVVYSALYPNNALAHRALRGTRTPLVWGFRNAEQPLSRLRARAMAYTRRHASEVALAIANCRSGAAFLEREGFRLRELRVIPNGVDTEAFRPDPAQGAAFRAELGVAPEAFVVGTVARLHPMKDHGSFLEAAARFAAQVPEARFLCVGGGPRAYAGSLARRARELGLEQRVLWTGPRDDVRAALNACDLVASTSLAEGFPNALCEALACERPCVATDVGDCAWVLGEDGLLVPPSDPVAQAAAWARTRALASEQRAARARRARARIAREFSLAACTQRTEQALLSARG